MTVGNYAYGAIRFPNRCVEFERDGVGWLVLRGDHGWLHGDRRQALRERDEIDHEERFRWGRSR
jgi:hypothetical protein